jgi:glycosidase
VNSPTSIKDLDLTRPQGKQYYNIEREWREEFIYFLLVDRFHDDQNRMPVLTNARSVSTGGSDQLGRYCGGTLKGILNHLDYIANLGCTALWISPVFENNYAPDKNADTYHGYAIQNYLDIDPRFGTKQDLIDIVNAAHDRRMRVFLDISINHSGDNWYYPGDAPYYYSDDMQFPLGGWRQANRPVPVELRNPNYYHRRGQIRHWDSSPEGQQGDFFSLKDFNSDETADGLALVDILVKAHCYWIREADIDGFRMDAVKHIKSIATSRFCSAIREYAAYLGKYQFFLFGELPAGDNAIDRYIGPNTPANRDDRNVFFGLNSVLDFSLYNTLPGVIKGWIQPGALINRYEALRNHAINRGELGRYLVTFLDNHDQIGQDPKWRFATGAPDAQVVAGIGYLLCALGTPCIYYGTEQGFSGHGDSEKYIREPLFSLQDQGVNYLNPDCPIYQEIAKIAKIFRDVEALRFGRMYWREVSGDGVHFGLPQEQPCTLAFSRILFDQEVLVAYNTSTTDQRHDFVIVDNTLQKAGGTMQFLYGKADAVSVQSDPTYGKCVQLDLEPMQFVILR